MAKNDIRTQSINLFHTGMNKDEEITYLKEGEYSNAINAVPFSVAGDLHAHSLSSEPATLKCSDYPMTLVGDILIDDKRHVIFTTNNSESEIGIFSEKDCSYTKLISSQCLGFNTNNLIKGVSRKDFQCGTVVYWNDGANSTRSLNIDNIPYQYTIKEANTPEGLPTKVYTNKLDCDALLLNPNMSIPLISIRDTTGGSLPNGSYRVAIAYSASQVRITDYLNISDIQSLFSKNKSSKAIEITLTDLDSSFDEYELVLISNIDQQTTAERIGFYSISQTSVTISTARDQARYTVPLEYLKLTTPFYDKAKDMVVLNNALVQFGVSSAPDIDYQRFANKVQVRYVAYKVPADYYRNGGNKVGYMRDEVYTFFIRWIKNNGAKTSWNNIPGLQPSDADTAVYSSPDVFESVIETCDEFTPKKKFQIVNTADSININSPLKGCKEFIIGEGNMSPWQSTEKYPDNEIWGERRGKFICHHKMPSCDHAHIHSNLGVNDNSIIIIGVRFSRIQHPVDSKGNPIEDIVGFEIARGSRKGNKSIVSKGMLHNMGEYEHPDTKQKTLYANYPFNDLRTDPFLVKKKKLFDKGTTSLAFNKFRDDVFTFHSPTVQYNKGNIGSEIRIETEEIGESQGSFEEVYNHPKHKLIRDFALLVGALVGAGAGLLAISGSKCDGFESSYNKNDGNTGMTTTVPTGATNTTNTKGAIGRALEIIGGAAKDIFSGFNPAKTVAKDAVGGIASGTVGPKYTRTQCSTPIKQLPKFLQIANSVFIFAYYFGEGTEAALRTIEKMVPFQQYAFQYNSHGLYFKYKEINEGQRRRGIQSFSHVNANNGNLVVNNDMYEINNVDRPYILALKLTSPINRPSTEDNSRFLMSDIGGSYKTVKRNISAYYASLRNELPSQYGQIDSVEVVSTGYIQKVKYNKNNKYYDSDIIFGGDTYINRYTEKKIMPYFSQSLYFEPNTNTQGFEFDYTKYPNIPNPRFWIDTFKYDLSQLIKIPSSLPNDKHNLDGNKGTGTSGTFVIKNGGFYLSNNGVIDFYCESEMNLDYRDWRDDSNKYKHYDPYEFTNLTQLFRSDILMWDNYFLYDRSLSADEQLNLTNGLIQSRDYNPKNNDCFSSLKNRVVYSLPQQMYLKKDNWRAFLANNYYDFPSSFGALVAIKPINKSGALFLFDQASPMMFQGQDTLNTDGGIKITIGDGGLFAQAPQNVINTDYSLGVCQSRWSIISTEFGTFFISQSHGKVFNFSGQLEEISMYGMSSWFRDHLPFKISKDFTNFTDVDNIVSGVGYTISFDNTYKLLYICKKDYKIKKEYKDDMTYDGVNFRYGGVIVNIGDPAYFTDASWTISYNPMMKKWSSFHSWTPDWIIQTETHFMSMKSNIIWKHNELWNLFCNFYNKRSVFEVEIPITGKEGVTTLTSISYNLECYIYNETGDMFHVLDYNFDEAIIWNSEEITGLLKMIMPKKGSMIDSNRYPIIFTDKIGIAYSKEEQSYSFNQFWDITKDRGEFTGKRTPMWITNPDGYTKEINPSYVNYAKRMVERKKLRHYWNKLILRKRMTDNVQMIFKWVNTKKTISPR